MISIMNLSTGNYDKTTATKFAKHAVYKWGLSAKHFWDSDYFVIEYEKMSDKERGEVAEAIEHQVGRTAKLLGYT